MNTDDPGYNSSDETNPLPVEETAALPQTPPPSPAYAGSEPLPVCDYTLDEQGPCEEPATVKRFSGAAVVASAAGGGVAGGVLVAAALVWALGLTPGSRPLTTIGGTQTNRSQGSVQQVSLSTTGTVSSVVGVAAKVTPSVVNVVVSQRVINRFTGQTSLQEAGNGSGIIIRQDGYILTNNHVVEGADSVKVKVGVEDLPATVVGTDPTTDLAVLKVARTGLVAAEFGNSSQLKVGEAVVAVGSPFGLESSVTSGIVSALGRSSFSTDSGSIATYTNLIQTDAAINPGNSGGALADERGRVIGINTLIESSVGQSAGIGFAIPIDFARTVADQLISSGKATHPFMGISTATVDQSVAQRYSLPVDAGALIQVVEPGSPAEKGGLQRGDIIVRIGDSDIASAEDVFTAIRSHKVGEAVEVEVVRSDKHQSVQVTLASDATRVQ